MATFQDNKPAPPARQIQYHVAGPITALGHDAPTLKEFMNTVAMPPGSSSTVAKRKTPDDQIPLRKLISKKLKPSVKVKLL